MKVDIEKAKYISETIKEICNNPFMNSCKDCPFNDEENTCVFYTLFENSCLPGDWKFEW